MIGLRFKLNNSQSIEPDIFSFYNIGTTDVNKTKTLELESVYGLKPFNHESTFNSLGSVFKPQGDIVTYYLSNSSFSDFITGSTKTYIVGKDYNLTSLVYALLQLPLNFNIHSLLAFDTIMLAAKSTLNLNFNFQITSAFTQTSPSEKCSFFQIGTDFFRVSIANSQASKAAFLCGAATVIITGISPICNIPSA